MQCQKDAAPSGGLSRVTRFLLLMAFLGGFAFLISQSYPDSKWFRKIFRTKRAVF